MTARDWAFLGCRMMALAHVTVAIMALPMTMIYMWTMPPGPIEPDLRMRFYDIAPLFMIATKVMMGGVLFYGAGFLSSMLFPASDVPAKPLPPKSIIAIGVLLVALFEALEYGPGLVQGLQQSLNQESAAKNAPTILANVVGLAFIAGLILWTWSALRGSRADSEAGPQ